MSHVEASIVYGSSPRLRGTRACAAFCAIGTRFIPALAGNTEPVTLRYPSSPVHPRACGEHSSFVFDDWPGDGSSPRLRGTRTCPAFGAFGTRFIPALAGNTIFVISAIGVNPVHPRACGEHRSAASPVKCFDGSSPRLRGTPRKDRECL